MISKILIYSRLSRLVLPAIAVGSTVFGCLGSDIYWNGNVSQDWTDPNNFQASGSNLPGVPQAGDTVYLESSGVRDPLINSSGNALLTEILLSHNMTYAAGGQLDAVYYKVGWDASATLTITGGVLNAANHLDVGGYSGGTAILNISGGSVNVGGLYLNLNGASTGASYLNLTGGTITELGPLSINTSHPAVLNLAGGTLILPASGNSGNVTYWVGHNIITAYGGTGTVNVDSSSNPGNLVLTGIPASVWYWNGNVSQSWTDGNNFQSYGSNLPGLPGAGSSVYFEPWAVQAPLINNVGNAGLNAVYDSKSMTVTAGGELDTTVYKVGWDATGVLNINGGLLWATNHLDVGGYNGATATMNMTNGLVDVGGLYLNLNGDSTSVGGSQFSLMGGTLNDSGTFSISEAHPALLNIAGGTLVVPASQSGNANFWMNDGSIAAYGVAGTTNSFNMDSVTVPGSLVIKAINPGFSIPTFTQWNPQVYSNLTGSLDQTMALVPAGLGVPTPGTYGFGTAVGTNGIVYYSDNANGAIDAYNPASGAVTTVVSGRPGAFGVAADNSGNLFYSQDLGAGNGLVIERTAVGSETTIINGLTSPRQLTTDTAGNLYVVLEQGIILKWTKSSGITTTLLGQNQIPYTAEGVAVTPNGRLYFSTYGKGTGIGTYLTEGAVWARETNGTVTLIAGGFSRARGLALAPSGDLYLATEASVWDNGNSGLLVKIVTNGVVTRAVTGIDYPQFPAIGANGILYVNGARDQVLLAYNPSNNYAAQVSPASGMALIADGATWQTSAGANYPIQLNLTNLSNPADNKTISGYLKFNPGSGTAGLWFNVPVTNLNLSLAQLPNASGNTNSGLFALPAASVNWAYSPANVEVIPLRGHVNCRWPMTNVGNAATEAPATNFAEVPISYLVYVTVSGPPLLSIQPWTGNQVRISWPTSATGYTLQRSVTVTGGYASPGLSVGVEGSQNAVYDTLGNGARFYRLTR